MTKLMKHLLLVCCSVALLICGALLVACGEEETPSGDEVSVAGQIVFEKDDYDEYTQDITLSFKPNGTDVQGVSAVLSYVNEEDVKVTAEGFTLAKDDGGYTLTDENGSHYALDLAWGSANPADDFAVVHGDFIVTDTIEDCEAPEAGSRRYIEEGYFGAGELDVSGKIWYYNFEDLWSYESSYLRFYNEYREDLAYIWDGTSARGKIWVGREFDDGNIYLIYYFITEDNGVRKALFYDIQWIPADAETINFEHFLGEFYFKKGERIYVSDAIDAGNVGDQVLTLFCKDSLQWGDGSLHARMYPMLESTYGNDGTTDWMLYGYAAYDEVGATEEFYFELDEAGNIKPETAQDGFRVHYQNTDKTWGYDAYYITPNETEIAFILLFAIGKVGNDGTTEYFEDPVIVKRADGEFTVYADGEAWNISIGLNQETDRIYFNAEAAEGPSA